MSEPFYLRCECGGELVMHVLTDGWHQCLSCGKETGARKMIECYAAALGVAVAALEAIWDLANEYNRPETAIAVGALKKIRGEKNQIREHNDDVDFRDEGAK